MIEIKNLSFGYPKRKKLFDDLELNLVPGNIYGLLGKNGAGKTTLLRLMTGMLFAQKGSCKMNGKIISDRQTHVMQNIFVLPEEYDLPAITPEVFKKVNAVFYNSFSSELFWKLLDEFDLDRKQKINSMSYGQKKKFLMAFGLATNAMFMVMDEPTNGLDIPSKSQFRKIMASTISDERCYIISTHQVRDLENLIDPVVIIDKGKIVFEQSIRNIASKLMFGNVSGNENSEVIYADGMEGRQKGVMVNTTDANSNIDMELLFNAVIFEYEKIENAFKN